MGLFRLDLATGEADEITVFDGKDATAAFSPDGRSLAYLARVSGMDYGLHVGPSDGTEMRLVALLEGRTLSDPLWSPDGEWLMVTVTSYVGAEATLTPALLSPATCEVFPLEGVDGYVFDWAAP
jgi:Tol biopolymer transport system component